jgi:DNA-binding LacI/PurR family transcriptional regulator
VLSGPVGFDASTGRAAAFADAVRTRGRIRTRAIAARGISGEDGTVAGRRLLERFPDTTAIFTTTLMLAVGLLRAAHERGVRVPEDLSILSMHDSEIAEYAWPPLTTIAMPMTELGSQSFDRLVQLIEGGRSTRPSASTVDLPPRLIVRGSTATPPS